MTTTAALTLTTAELPNLSTAQLAVLNSKLLNIDAATTYIKGIGGAS